MRPLAPSPSRLHATSPGSRLSFYRHSARGGDRAQPAQGPFSPGETLSCGLEAPHGADICAPSFSRPPCPGGSELGKRRLKASGSTQPELQAKSKPITKANQTGQSKKPRSRLRGTSVRTRPGRRGPCGAGPVSAGLERPTSSRGAQPGPRVSPEQSVARSAVDPAPVSNGRNAWSPAPRSAPPQIPRCLEEDT